MPAAMGLSLIETRQALAEALAVGSSDGEEVAAAEALAEGSSDNESQIEAGGSEAEHGAAAQDGAAGLAVATTGTGSEEEGRPARVQVQSQAGSMQSLRRQLAQAKQAQQQQKDGTAAEDAAAVPVEMGRILSADDFARIRELRHK